MNNRHGSIPNQGSDQSPLSLLVNAADNHEPPRGQQRDGGIMQGRGFAETLRLRGLGGDAGLSLEEQLYLQQHAQNAYGAPMSGGLLGQFRDQGIFSQYGGQQQQQQLASLLGLGGGNNNHSADMRSALAAAQLRQHHQQQQQQPRLSHAEILALSRSGALNGLSGILGGMGGVRGPGSNSALASELEGLQRLEERRQQLLAASSQSPMVSSSRRPVEASSGMLREDPSERMVRQDHKVQHKKKASTAAVTSEAALSALPAGASNKDEMEKAPGSVIVPCRARGMPMDHNFKTAYFVIPENVKHGEELICSYFACRNAGIKFRYCSHCKVPVAKRNFRKRHKHGGEDIPKGPDDDSGGEDDHTDMKNGIPAQISTPYDNAVEADGISSHSADSDIHDKQPIEMDAKTAGVRSSRSTMEKDQTMKTNSAMQKPVSPKKLIDKTGKDRHERWVALLATRPATKDGGSMSSWLMEVLAVSDLETPLPSTPAADKGKKNSYNGSKTESKKKKNPDLPVTKFSTIDPGSGSSNDASANEHSDRSKHSKPMDSKTKATGVFVGGIVKKKRSFDITKEESLSEGGSETFASGSFAEWKERKRQKKQAKSGSLSSKEDHEQN